jgi:hypothetical protein
MLKHTSVTFRKKLLPHPHQLQICCSISVVKHKKRRTGENINDKIEDFSLVSLESLVVTIKKKSRFSVPCKICCAV